MSRPLVYTLGHGARTLESFLDLVAAAGLRELIDVRFRPVSRRHPQFSREGLAAVLPERGVTYRWAGRDLGGFRSPRPDSPHVAIRDEALRGYADHMETLAFRRAAARVLELAAPAPAGVMCAETDPEACHRRFLSDYLVVLGAEVIHAIGCDERRPHRLHEAARVCGERLVYDAGRGRQRGLFEGGDVPPRA